MKKLIKIFVFFLVLVGLIGCTEGEIPDNGEKGEPYLYLVSDNYMLYVNDEKDIEYYVENIDEFSVEYEILDEEVAKIIDGKLVGVWGGETILKVSILGKPNTVQEATIKVIIRDIDIAYKIIDWAKEEIGTDLLNPSVFPTKHPSYPEAVISYKSSDTTLLKDNGLTFPATDDKEVNVSINVNYNGVVAEKEHKVNVIGNAQKEIINTFFEQFPIALTKDIEINYFKIKFPNAKITFESLNQDVFTNLGEYKKPLNDTEITFAVTLEILGTEYKKVFYKTIIARGLSIYDKAVEVRKDIIAGFNLENDYVDKAIEFPFSETRYNGTITWKSNQPDIINSSGQINFPLVNVLVDLVGTLTVGKESTTFIITLEIAGKASNDKWNNIEEFLETYIFKDIETLKYNVMGVAPSYIAYNDGYVLFYENKDLEVIQALLPTNHPFRPKTPIDLKYITIHDTAGNGSGADAAMHNKYIQVTDRTTSSWHYTIDDRELYQHIPNNEVAWHAGDSVGNKTSIGIETCTYLEGDYDLTIRRTAKLVAKLLDDYNLTLKNVKQHFDWSGKNCPQVIRGSNRWGELIHLISLELYARQNLGDVEFEWKSLSPDILDDTGKVFAHPGNKTTVKYQVTVTYNNESKVYTYTANLEAKK